MKEAVAKFGGGESCMVHAGGHYCTESRSVQSVRLAMRAVIG